MADDVAGRFLVLRLLTALLGRRRLGGAGEGSNDRVLRVVAGDGEWPLAVGPAEDPALRDEKWPSAAALLKRGARGFTRAADKERVQDPGRAAVAANARLVVTESVGVELPTSAATVRRAFGICRQHLKRDALLAIVSSRDLGLDRDAVGTGERRQQGGGLWLCVETPEGGRPI